MKQCEYSEFSLCCHPRILLPWQRDVTTFYGLSSTNHMQALSADLACCYIFIHSQKT